jgi:uncharacterized protein YeaO (DUF488 family)
MKIGKNVTTDREWLMFKKKYRLEMATPENSRILELLAALSHHTNFSVGCYCEVEARCHRSVLRELFIEKGAKVEQEDP